jgi:hypothetical protein
MRDVLLWLLAFLATWVVLLVVVATLLRWRLQRRNRVSPAVKSPAPITWLWSPAQPARLHRRLQGAVAEIHLAPSRRSDFRQPSSADDLRRELEYQAVELDQHLVVAARQHRARRRSMVKALQAQVGDVEELSVRLSRLSARPDGTPASGWDVTREPPDVLSGIAHQLDLLDAAQAELAEIERAAGLLGPDDEGYLSFDGSGPTGTGLDGGAVDELSPPPPPPPATR